MVVGIWGGLKDPFAGELIGEGFHPIALEIDCVGQKDFEVIRNREFGD